MGNIYDILLDKLKGNISNEDFSEKCEEFKFFDVKDINRKNLYGDI